MKKNTVIALAIAAIAVVFIFTTAISCGSYKYEDNIIDYDNDALMVNVVSYSTGSGETARSVFEVQVGITSDFTDETYFPDNPDYISTSDFTQADFDAAVKEACGVPLSFLGFYRIATSPLALSKTIYCYKVEGNFEYNISSSNVKYGFFYMSRDYKITNPSWTDGLEKRIFNKLKDDLTLDENKIEYRFYLATDSEVKTKDGVHVMKNILSLGDDAYNCLMFKPADFTEIEFTTRAMASGWFIVAIIMGVAVVAVLFIVEKHLGNKEDVFKQEVEEGNARVEDEQDRIIIEQDPFADDKQDKFSNADPFEEDPFKENDNDQ